MSKGFSGVPGNMQALVKQAQKMQQDLQKAQAQAELVECEGSAGGGMVKVTVNGKMQVISVFVNKECVNPNDVDMLQDLILAATNEALEKAKENTKQTLGAVTGGVGIPGLF